MCHILNRAVLKNSDSTKMEKKPFRQTKSSSRTSTMKTTFCIPRFRTASRKSSRLSPAMSLLDRFREAVFRLIMLSAISKAAAANSDHRDSRSSTSSVTSPANCHGRSCYYSYQSNDVYQSEAVADCIEFIKRSVNDDRDGRDSITSDQVVMPLPVV